MKRAGRWLFNFEGVHMRALIVLVAGLFISNGCIVIPGPESFKPGSNSSDKPKDIRRLLGEPGSDRPIRAGQTRDQLHAILSTPLMLSADKSIESYIFYRHYGYFLALPFFGHLGGNQTKYDPFDLVLHFDTEDRLSAWEFGERIVRSGNTFSLRYRVGGTELYWIDHEKGWPTTQAYYAR